MMLKKFICTAAAFAVSLSAYSIPAAAEAPTEKADCLTIRFYDSDGDNEYDYGAVIGCDKDAENAVIPAMVNDVPITAIMTDSSKKGAFEMCHKLKTVEIPETVTSISLPVFKNCSGLTKITVSEDNPKYASIDGILYTKDKKTLLRCPPRYAGEIVFPEELTKFDNFSFSGCTTVKELIMPDTVTIVGTSAFEECSSFKSVTMSKSLKTISDQGFMGCSAVKEFTVPKSVQKVGVQAFAYCTDLEKLTFLNPDCSISTLALTGGKKAPVIYGYSGSAAEKLADFKELTFIPLDTAAVGDINGDGEVGAADLVMLMNYLSGSDTALTYTAAADLCPDGRIDAFDMVMMRKAVINADK